MIILDKPYVSDLLLRTIRTNQFPVVRNDYSKRFSAKLGDLILSGDEAVKRVRESTLPQIYTTSENSIGWIAKNLGFTGLPEKIELFKDKVRFREMIHPMYPDYFFREIALDSLDELDGAIMKNSNVGSTFGSNHIPLPFIIKPAVGFFSMGVHRVDKVEEWEATKRSIREGIEAVMGLYPEEVLKTTSFIIEEVIEGEEFAIDAYFTIEGEPVILSILRHSFAHECDMSDRIYQSSKEIVEENLEEFTAFLKNIGTLADVRNFPVHVEVRREESGRLVPIEINPMRFGGWCTTPDLTYFAYGLNPYEYYFAQRKPDWDSILEKKDELVYSMILLENSTGYPEEKITSFDYDRLLSTFSNPLELRKIDFHEYPVFAILFTETDTDDAQELEAILHSDLREYVRLVDE